MTMPAREPARTPGRHPDTVGRYKVLDRIGRGAMGMVYAAEDEAMGRHVAVKVMAADLEDEPEIRERFYREARITGQLNHRNIVTVFDLGEDHGHPYLVMELLHGVDLQVITLTTPGTLVDPPAVAARLAAITNDAFARVRAERPTRFLPLATLPLCDPAASTAEFVRATDQLGERPHPGTTRRVLGTNLERKSPLPTQRSIRLDNADARVVDVCNLRGHPVQLDYLEVAAGFEIFNRRSTYVESAKVESRERAADFIDSPCKLGSLDPSPV